MRLKTAALAHLLLTLMLANVPAQTGGRDGQPKWRLPETPRARIAAPLLNAVEGGDESVRQFFAEHVAPEFRDAFPLDEHVKVFRELRRSLGAFELAGLEATGPHEARLTLRAKESGETYTIDYAVEPAPPHRLASMRWEKAAAEKALAFNSFGELDEALRKAAAEDRFSGAVFVAKGGRPVFLKVYGLADRERNIPVREETLFDIGSINKMFTSVAVLRLAQEGKLGLDDPLGKHLKGFPAGVAEKVTIRQLLQHRSGMGDYLTHPAFRENPKGFRAVADYLELARATPLGFEPGTRQSYSNTGFAVLGGIIEAVTGRSYYDVIDEYVYHPAGMKSSGSFDRTKGAQNMAVGYTNRGQGAAAGDAPRPRSITERYSPTGSPAGGGFSTAEDLYRFVNALLDHKLLDRRHSELLLNGFSTSEGGRKGGSIIFGGGSDGVNAAVAVNLDTRDVVVVLANRDEPAAERIGEAVFRRLKSL